MAKKKKMILEPDIIKSAVKLHIRRINENQNALVYFQKICIHEFEYAGVTNLQDYEQCKICGLRQKLPKSYISICPVCGDSEMIKNRSDMEVAKEWIEGRLSKKSEKDNPYEIGSWQWALWWNGYMSKDELKELIEKEKQDGQNNNK